MTPATESELWLLVVKISCPFWVVWPPFVLFTTHFVLSIVVPSKESPFTGPNDVSGVLDTEVVVGVGEYVGLGVVVVADVEVDVDLGVIIDVGDRIVERCVQPVSKNIAIKITKISRLIIMFLPSLVY